jgi:hypothetical protein
LFDLQIVLIQEVFRVEVDLVADWFEIVSSSKKFRSVRISWADRSAARGDCDEELQIRSREVQAAELSRSSGAQLARSIAPLAIEGVRGSSSLAPGRPGASVLPT